MKSKLHSLFVLLLHLGLFTNIEVLALDNTDENMLNNNKNISINKTDTSINIKGNVIVSYLDNEGNKLQEDITITDLINNDYITKEQKIEGYELVNINGNISGKITNKDIYVEYIYSHNSNNYDEKLIKTGTLKIDNPDNRIDYNIKYNNVIDNYIGPVEVMIIDYLPYKIDIDNSILDDFIYHEEDNILVYIYKDNINTYTNGRYNINIDKNLTLKYIGINEEDRIITNKVESLIITDKSDISEDTLTTNIEIKSSVTGEYIDTLGNKIENDITKTNLIGNDYVLEKLDIKGYTLKEIKGNNIDKHTKEDKIVTFIYEKNKETPPKTGINENNYISNSVLISVLISLSSIIFKRKLTNNIL